MKKVYPFLLVSLFIISGNCFADEDEEFIEQFIRNFQRLPRPQQVEKIANARLVDGYIESIPDLSSAFAKHPEKKRALYDLARELKPEIMEYCWERLDDVFQAFLDEFEKRPIKERKEVTFRYHDDGRLEVEMPSEEQRKHLETMVKDQREPFCVYATFLQMSDSTEHQAEKMEPSHAHHGRFSRFLHKLIAAKA